MGWIFEVMYEQQFQRTQNHRRHVWLQEQYEMRHNNRKKAHDLFKTCEQRPKSDPSGLNETRI